MRKHKLIILSLFASISLFAQTTGDFNAISSGSWDNTNTWEYYNGTSWQTPAPFYPGQTGNTTNDVVIGNNVTVTIDNPNAPETINSLTVGDQMGGIGGIDTLLITDDSTLYTTSITIAYDGFVDWGGTGSSNYFLTFPDPSTNLVVEPVNPYGLTLGTDHGLNENTGSCSNSKGIEIGPDSYTTCQGAGGNLSFNTVNNGGGNLSVSATADNTIICENSIVQLTATPGGLDSGEPNPSYNWIVVLPNGDTETVSTDQNPTTTITEVGTHTFEVTFTNDSGITTYNTVQVIGRECKNVVTNRRITYRVTPQVSGFGPTGTKVSNFIPDWTSQTFQHNIYQFRLQFYVQTPINNWEIFIENVPYSDISITLNTNYTNGDTVPYTLTSEYDEDTMTYNHLITSNYNGNPGSPGDQIAFAGLTIGGSATDDCCISFYIID